MVKHIIYFLVIGLGLQSATTAPELRADGENWEDLPPQAELELPANTSSKAPVSLTPADNRPLEPIPSGDLRASSHSGCYGEEGQLFAETPLRLESTGTWLRRGFWSAEFDITLMDRIWRRDELVLMGQITGTRADGLPIIGGRIALDGGISGAEATPRLKLNRFLFRDSLNRDHTAEIILYGGGQWTQTGRLDASSSGNGTLTTLRTESFRLPNSIANITVDLPYTAAPSFTGATSTQYEYNNRFNSFELNYHVKSRMLRDRMELEPSGRWVRRAQPSNTRSLLAGIRYLDLNEDMTWDAFNIPDADANGLPETGNYRARTDNDLIGTQLGFSWTHERARWSLGLRSKGGIFWNHTNLDSAFLVTGGVTEGGSDVEVDNLSFVTEGALQAKWHLRPNLSLRAGLEILYVSSIAHAAEQLNFVPVNNSQRLATGDSTYMGASIGFEGYW